MGSLTFPVIENIVRSFSISDLLHYFDIQTFKIGFGESIVGEESLNFVFNVLDNVAVASVFGFELIDEQTLELFSLLDLHESLLPGFAQLS